MDLVCTISVITSLIAGISSTTRNIMFAKTRVILELPITILINHLALGNAQNRVLNHHKASFNLPHLVLPLLHHQEASHMLNQRGKAQTDHTPHRQTPTRISLEQCLDNMEHLQAHHFKAHRPKPQILQLGMAR